MPHNDAVSKTLDSAKGALAHANASFPGSSPSPKTAPASASVKSAPTLGDELKVKSDNVQNYMSSLPKMHSGGPVATDGAYQLKAGEHVLTAPEAAQARKHAMMAAGMKSPAKTPVTSGEPKKQDAAIKKPAKKMTKGVTVRPEKNQGAKIVVKK